MAESHLDQVARVLLRAHPLQRLSSPSRTLSLALHATLMEYAVLGLANFISCFKYLVDNPNAMNEAYGWHLQYLTIIGLSLATATFAMGSLADITLNRYLFVAKNSLSVASAPMEVLISVLYWSIRTIDVRLVLPDWLDPLPLPRDLSFHAAPAVLMVIDLLFFSPPWTISALPALGLSGLIATGYWFWVEQCYAQNGFYPYPIFEVDVELRIGLFVMSAFVMTFSTFCLKWLYKAINGAVNLNQTYELRSRNIKRA